MSKSTGFVHIGSINGSRGLPVRSREIAPGIHWLSSCSEVIQPSGTLHIHTSSAYLVVGGQETLLVDVGSAPFAAGVAAALGAILGPRTLDWLFPTHLEHPHAGGLRPLATRYPAAKIIADAHDYAYYFPELAPRVRHAVPGDELDLGDGYRFTFLPAVFKDLATTLWGYEESQEVMFVSDGFSYAHHDDAEELGESVHLPEECTALLSELPRSPTIAEAAFLNRAAMWWTHHRPIDPFVDEFRAVLARYPSRLFAPAHGGVIDDIDGFLPIMQAGCEIAYEMGARESVVSK